MTRQLEPSAPIVDRDGRSTLYWQEVVKELLARIDDLETRLAALEP